MKLTKVAGGIALIAVSLGSVCPQLAQLRINGVLPPEGVLLLLLGTGGTLGGVWCIAGGFRRRETPAS